MRNHELPIWAICVALPIFVVFLRFISYLQAEESGWTVLAKKYRFRGQFKGEKSSGEYGFMGSVYFKGTFIVGICPDGLYLAANIWASACKPPLLIPWSKLFNIQRRKTLLGLDQAIMDVDEPKITTIGIDWNLIEKSNTWIGQRL
jgi:hypothetical protein